MHMHHEHTHDHEHAHEHSHEHSHDHENCTPEEELIALMKYMVGHNAAHAEELAGLAERIRDIGKQEAYEQIMQAVADFEKGNERLSQVLSKM